MLLWFLTGFHYNKCIKDEEINTWSKIVKFVQTFNDRHLGGDQLSRHMNRSFPPKVFFWGRWGG